MRTSLELKTTEVNAYHFHPLVTLVPNENDQEPMKVGAVLDGGSGVTCISKKVDAQVGAYFAG